MVPKMLYAIFFHPNEPSWKARTLKKMGKNVSICHGKGGGGGEPGIGINQTIKPRNIIAHGKKDRIRTKTEKTKMADLRGDKLVFVFIENTASTVNKKPS
ncbi:MAG: hypothetical protein HQM10_13900 [Candidatus Riflebacteria bacterium]|nr:hypothetical protein [Candidatus Riflebacteria bacterium]